MTSDLIRQRHNGRKIRDRPSQRRTGTKVNHTRDDGNAEHIHVLEVPDDLIKTDAEPLFLDFLGRSGPFHLDGEEMAEERGREVDGESAEEEDEHGRPF